MNKILIVFTNVIFFMGVYSIYYHGNDNNFTYFGVSCIFVLIYLVVLSLYFVEFDKLKKVRNKKMKYVDYSIKLIAFLMAFIFSNSDDIKNFNNFLILYLIMNIVLSTILLLVIYKDVSFHEKILNTFLHEYNREDKDLQKQEIKVNALIITANGFFSWMFVLPMLIDVRLPMTSIILILLSLLTLIYSIILAYKLTSINRKKSIKKANCIKIISVILAFIIALISGILHEGIHVNFLALLTCTILMTIYWNYNKVVN